MSKTHKEVCDIVLDVLELFFDEVQGGDWKMNEGQKEIYSKTRELLIINDRL